MPLGYVPVHPRHRIHRVSGVKGCHRVIRSLSHLSILSGGLLVRDGVYQSMLWVAYDTIKVTVVGYPGAMSLPDSRRQSLAGIPGGLLDGGCLGGKVRFGRAFGSCAGITGFKPTGSRATVIGVGSRLLTVLPSDHLSNPVRL